MRSLATLVAALVILASPAIAEPENAIDLQDIAAVSEPIMRNWLFDPARLPECPEPFTVRILLAPDGVVEQVESTSDLADGYCKTLFESFRRAAYITRKFDLPGGATAKHLDVTIDPAMLVY